jgi:hypothetical protein
LHLLCFEISRHDIPIDNISKVSEMTAGSIKFVYRLLYVRREKFKDLVDIREVDLKEVDMKEVDMKMT